MRRRTLWHLGCLHQVVTCSFCLLCLGNCVVLSPSFWFLVAGPWIWRSWWWRIVGGRAKSIVCLGYSYWTSGTADPTSKWSLGLFSWTQLWSLSSYTAAQQLHLSWWANLHPLSAALSDLSTPPRGCLNRARRYWYGWVWDGGWWCRVFEAESEYLHPWFWWRPSPALCWPGWAIYGSLWCGLSCISWHTAQADLTESTG